MTPLDEQISEAVRVESARRRMTQQDVADALGLSRSAIYARLTGRQSWRVNELPPLSTALGVTVNQLIGGDR